MRARRISEPSTWIVVPVRSLADGKRRLASVLDPGERATLVRRLFARTVETALEAGPPVLVVSPDPDALALARRCGAEGLLEPPPTGLNRALELAARTLVEQGAAALLVVSADLPDIDTADLHAMLPTAVSDPGGAAAGRGSSEETAPPPGRATGPDAAVRIAPDAAGSGTNALYVRPPGLLVFEYGDGSCPRHLEQARARGARIERVDRPGLRFDLDTPDDLARYEQRRLWRSSSHGENEDR